MVDGWMTGCFCIHPKLNTCGFNLGWMSELAVLAVWHRVSHLCKDTLQRGWLQHKNRMRSVLLHCHSGHRGGHNRGCPLNLFYTIGLAQSVVAVTASSLLLQSVTLPTVICAQQPAIVRHHLLLIVAIEIAHAMLTLANAVHLSSNIKRGKGS